jgi:hypothetical protein
MELSGFSNSDWAEDCQDWCSTSGYTCSLGAGSISWKSRKQATVLLSSTEAEYKAMSDSCKEGLMWLRNLLCELKLIPSISIPLHINNAGAKGPRTPNTTRQCPIPLHLGVRQEGKAPGPSCTNKGYVGWYAHQAPSTCSSGVSLSGNRGCLIFFSISLSNFLLLFLIFSFFFLIFFSFFLSFSAVQQGGVLSYLIFCFLCFHICFTFSICEISSVYLVPGSACVEGLSSSFHVSHTPCHAAPGMHFTSLLSLSFFQSLFFLPLFPLSLMQSILPRLTHSVSRCSSVIASTLPRVQACCWNRFVF